MTDQTNKDLPPLPKPVKVLYIEGEECPIFGRGQMHAYARAALSASAPTTAPIEALSSECNECGGTGLRDLGGFYPWGEPTMIECDCISKMPTPNAPAAGSAPSDEEISALWEVCDTPCEANDFTTGPLPFARALLAQYGGSVRIAAEQEIIDAARNLVKVKGRFHTEGAYLRLINAVEAAPQEGK